MTLFHLNQKIVVLLLLQGSVRGLIPVCEHTMSRKVEYSFLASFHDTISDIYLYY